MVKFDKLRDDLALNLKVRRAELSISQEQLALKADTERMQISLIERRMGNPTLKTLHQIADALGMEVSELLASRGKAKSS